MNLLPMNLPGIATTPGMHVYDRKPRPMRILAHAGHKLADDCPPVNPVRCRNGSAGA